MLKQSIPPDILESSERISGGIHGQWRKLNLRVIHLVNRKSIIDKTASITANATIIDGIDFKYVP